ncbi:helix-turn-helix transcriptional regulator [Clostridium botulinum]|nr:helix-turn-helix transcriptional regulator [Clostridium botulinum]
MMGGKNIVDIYYKYIEEEYCYKTCDELLGKRYLIGDKAKLGDFSRMKIEDGLEISRVNINNKMNMDFYNKGFEDNILEIGYCYSGSMKVHSLPSNKEYDINAGDIFVYKTLNNVDYFKFKYQVYNCISVHINFNSIKNAINPIWEDKMIDEWELKLDRIFKKEVLIVEKVPYEIKKIADEMQNISINTMMDYIKLKLNCIRFLAEFLEITDRNKETKGISNYEDDIVIGAKKVIDENLQDTPSVKEIAIELETSLYKLQQAFKHITGDTVYEYIKRIKMEKAKKLLRDTEMSIMEITNEVGYENPSKFAALFKNYNNITPLKYRKLRKS